MDQEHGHDDRVRLVEYTIVSIERGKERVMPGACSRCVIDSDDTRGCNLDTWLIARYVSEYGVKVPSRFLRVAHTVLGSWPKPPLHFREEQLRRLAGIRRALLLTIGGEPDTEDLPPAAPPTNRPKALPAAWVEARHEEPASAWPWPIVPNTVAASESAAEESVKEPDVIESTKSRPKSKHKLTDISGLGPTSAEALTAAGISTLEDLAATAVDGLREILQKGGVNLNLVNPDDWPEKALALMNKS